MSEYDVEADYAKVGINRSDFDNGDLKMADYFSIPPMFFTKDLANVPFINRYNNGHAFLIASGPSFANVDVEKLSQPGILTMGLNNSPASFRPNLWTCVDTPSNFLASIWMDPKIEKIVPISHINKKLFDSSKWKDMNIAVGDCPNVFYYRRNEVVNTDDYCFEDCINWGNHTKVGGGRSVLLAAMRILFLLGVRNVYLLGVDFNMNENNKYHFEQDRNKGSINGNNSTYNSMKRWFTEINEHFKSAGHNVYNCNPDSQLPAFEHIDFDEAIKRSIDGMPIPAKEKTAGMYTRRADQEKEREKKQVELNAQKYSDADRKKAKDALDQARSKLDDAKEELNQVLQRAFPDYGKECYMWAHKLKKPSVPVLVQLYDFHKNNMNREEKPTDELHLELYKAQKGIEKVRQNFRQAEKNKNLVWGIAK